MVTKFIDYTESVLPDDASVNRGFIRKDFFDMKNNKQNHARKLWLLLKLKLWSKKNLVSSVI